MDRFSCSKTVQWTVFPVQEKPTKSRITITDSGVVQVSTLDQKDSIQRQAYCLFARLESHDSESFELDLYNKIEVTFGSALGSKLKRNPNWFSKLLRAFPFTKQQAQLALLKSYVGGWTTTCRMHEQKRLTCLFGCKDAEDELLHYIYCAPLWLIASEAFGCSSSLSVDERLCFADVTPQTVHIHAVAFQVYHFLKSKLAADADGGLVQPAPQYAQQVAVECSLTFCARYR